MIDKERVLNEAGAMRHKNEENKKSDDEKSRMRHLAAAARQPAARPRGLRDAFGDGSDDEDGKDAVDERKSDTNPSSRSSAADLDPAVLSLVLKTAAWACSNPQKFDVLVQNSRANENLFFLYDKQSAAGKKFIEELARLRACLEVQNVTGSLGGGPASGAAPPPPPPSSAPPAANSHAIQNAILQAREKAAQLSASLAASSTLQVDGPRPAKRNRWGPAFSDPGYPPTAPAAIRASPTVSISGNAAGESSESIASLWNDSVDYSAKFEAQLREQKELQLLESRVREAAARQVRSEQREELRQQILSGCESDELQAERIRQYEALAKLDDPNFRDTITDAELNGGVIEGGTWEHRKRAKEMLATAQKNYEITAISSGKHHMADFLPQEELNKFLKKSTAVLQGRPVPKEEDYAEHKIGDDNIGFQMLKKVGWSQGAGLGPQENNSSGRTAAITTPINSGASAAGITGAGLGSAVGATHEVTEGDSEFDAYRKRMMLAYRFRPNPLNNPRRNYY
jgi:hypothetical protein